MSRTHNAGIVTAYGAAVRGGYTGTYEEFCAQQAQYAENARQMEQAVSDVRDIKTSVESAVSVAEAHANDAEQSATNASNSATQASQSASNANQSAESASQSATNASNSADDAEQSATSAQTSANNASESERNAQQSAEDAQDILDSVQAEGNTQISRVQAKGQEVLDSLPEDFTEVQQEISKINGSLSAEVTKINDSINAVYEGVSIDADMFEKGSVSNSGENSTYRRVCRCRLINKHIYNVDVDFTIVNTSTQVTVMYYDNTGTSTSYVTKTSGSYTIPAKSLFRLVIDGRRGQTEEEMTVAEILEGVEFFAIDASIKQLRTDVNNVQSQLGNVIPDYYFTDNYLPEKAREAQLAAGVNGISFGFITDIHTGDNAQNSMKLAKYIADHTSALPLMICGGDIPETNTGDLNGLYEQAQAWQLMMSQYGKHNVYTCRGNHDYIASVNNTGIKAKNALSNSYVMGYLPYGITPGMEGKPYYYFDVEWAKTRFIVLDEYSVSNTDPDADTSVYVGLSADEYNWFVNTALKVDNYHIVIVSHQPLNLPNYEGYNASLNLLRDIITAFNQHVAFTGSYGAASINVDFSTYTSELVCVLSGHIHKDISSDTGFLNIVTTSDACYSTDGYGRQFGTISENAFDIVSIDYNNRVIKCTRIGAGDSRQFSF